MIKSLIFITTLNGVLRLLTALLTYIIIPIYIYINYLQVYFRTALRDMLDLEHIKFICKHSTKRDFF